MIPDLIAQYTGLDPEAVQNAWTVLVTNGVLVTTCIVIKKALAPARAVVRWLRGKPPEPTPLCGAILVALADGAAGERDGLIRCVPRGLVLRTDSGSTTLNLVQIDGRPGNRLDDLPRADRRRVERAVGEARRRWKAKQLAEDTDRLLSYRDPLAAATCRANFAKVEARAADVPPLKPENVL